MQSSVQKSPDIVIFGHFEPRGGVQRVLANMIKEWTHEAYKVEVVSYRFGSLFYSDEIIKDVNFTELQTNGKITTLISLWFYLLKKRPSIIVSTAHIANKIVSYLSFFPLLSTRRFVVIQNNFVRSQRREDSEHAVKLREVKKLYKYNHGVIVASQGIKGDLHHELGLQNVPIHVIWNAAITKHNFERAQEPVDHPWLQKDREIPVIINVARLAPQKDLQTLIDAVSQVRQNKRCRLIILGEGPLRDDLLEHARKHGLEDDFDLPGFVDNPYAWMARTDCFALSSIWEGFGIVLAEALSLGLPVISTDCPSGPSEILQDGRYGKLVPMQDSKAMAEAIEKTLDGDIEEFDPMEAVERFTAQYASHRYLEAFGLRENN
mgnify:CR=1 FL=1